MALALQIAGTPWTSTKHATSLNRAVELDPKAHLCHAERGRLEPGRQSWMAARQAMDAALAVSGPTRRFALGRSGRPPAPTRRAIVTSAIAQLQEGDSLRCLVSLTAGHSSRGLEHGDNRVTCLEAARTNATSPIISRGSKAVIFLRGV